MNRNTNESKQNTASCIRTGFFSKNQAKGSHLKRRGERGQAFIELALSLVFLLMIVSVVIDLGWSFYTLIALRDAAQEAASYGAMCPLMSNNTSPNTNMIREHLRLSATTPLDMNDIETNNITVVFTSPTGTQLGPSATPIMGGNIIVTATINHEIMTPFLGAIIGRQDYPLTVSVSNPVMRSKWMSPCDE